MAPSDFVSGALGCSRNRVGRAAFPRTQSDLFARFPLLWVPGMPVECIGYCARNWGSAQSPSPASFPAGEGGNSFLVFFYSFVFFCNLAFCVYSYAAN